MKENEGKSNSIGLTKLYLLTYNILSAFGWLWILVITVKSLLQFKTFDDLLKSKNLYKNVSYWLTLFLFSAFLEVLHAALKLVRSNPLLNFIQIFTRILIVWAMMGYFEASKQCVGVLLVCVAWSFTEVFRYSYYAMNILGFSPFILTWLRYSLFIVFYPFGVLGELVCIFYAIYNVYTSKQVRDKYSYKLPNNLNFSYDILFVLCACVIAYFPGFPTLYKHMLSQRRKVLSEANKPKQN